MEATASLDVESETRVQEALSRLLQHKTVLVIAHRMRTVMNADKIVGARQGACCRAGKAVRTYEMPRRFVQKNGRAPGDDEPSFALVGVV